MLSGYAGWVLMLATLRVRNSPGHAGLDINGDVFVTQKCRHGTFRQPRHFLSHLNNSSFLHYLPELIVSLEAKQWCF